MFQSNLPFNQWPQCSLPSSMTNLFGGYVQMSAALSTSSGNLTKFTSGQAFYYWKDANTGQNLYQSDSRVFTPSSVDLGNWIWNNVNSNLPAGTNAYLVVVINIAVENAEGTLFDYLCYAHQTSINFTGPCVQVTANPPDHSPIPNEAVYVYAEVDFNATGYNAEFTNCSLISQNFNQFLIAVGSSGTASWKARAYNSLGNGPWSNICSFTVQEVIDGTLNVSLNEQPGKPIHSIDSSFNCTSGHTVTSYSWNIYKQVNGNWQLIDSSSVSNYANTFTDNPTGINYKISLTVVGIKNNNSSSKYFEEFVSYGI